MLVNEDKGTFSTPRIHRRRYATQYGDYPVLEIEHIEDEIDCGDRKDENLRSWELHVIKESVREFSQLKRRK